MFKDDKRIRMFCGHYGSGKTEFAVNYVTKLKEEVGQDKKVVISDMDIVNPYFRSREKKAELEDKGIVVYGSSYNNDADIPAVPAEMMGPFIDKKCDYIIDLGGNDVGTIVLGRYKEHFDPEEIDVFMVVNTYRPDTYDADLVIEQMHELEAGIGLKVTGFVNNTNLVRETCADDLLRGEEILSDVSRKTGVPIRYTAYVEEVVKDMTPKVKAELSGEVVPLTYYMRASWM